MVRYVLSLPDGLDVLVIDNEVRDECGLQNGHKPNFYELRTFLVTQNTKTNNEEYIKIKKIIEDLKKQKKSSIEDTSAIDADINKYKIYLKEFAKTLNSSKNAHINDWEFNTPKDIRAGAVNDLCKAHKTIFANLKAGNIKHFSLKFRKKESSTKSILLPKSLITIEDNNTIKIAPSYFNNDECKFLIGNRTSKKHKDIVINNDCRLLKKNNEYFLFVPIKVNKVEKIKPKNYCGVDPGIRTFMTTFGNNGVVEYTHNKVLLDKLNNKINTIKALKKCNKRKSLCKCESKKENIINELHWKTIHSLLSLNDVILYGDIKSHNIVKKSSNKTLNRNFNDLKFYQFSERLLYKADICGKLVIKVNEAFTSQTCSCCGTINKVGCSKTYECIECKSIFDRDINAAKNILLKGIKTAL